MLSSSFGYNDRDFNIFNASLSFINFAKLSNASTLLPHTLDSDRAKRFWIFSFILVSFICYLSSSRSFNYCMAAFDLRNYCLLLLSDDRFYPIWWGVTVYALILFNIAFFEWSLYFCCYSSVPLLICFT